MKVRAGDDAEAEMEHPVIRYIPESGRRCLFVNPVYTIRFAGWTEEESKPLLDFLHTHAVRPEHTCRFKWETGSGSCTDFNLFYGHCELLLERDGSAGIRRFSDRVQNLLTAPCIHEIWRRRSSVLNALVEVLHQYPEGH